LYRIYPKILTGICRWL